MSAALRVDAGPLYRPCVAANLLFGPGLARPAEELVYVQLSGARREGAPGVYVGTAKIAALGLRIKHGCSYHGVSLNVDMDLTPYAAINPCGYAGLRVTRLADLGITVDSEEQLKVRRAMPGRVAKVTCCRPSKTMCSYTSSLSR